MNSILKFLINTRSRPLCRFMGINRLTADGKVIPKVKNYESRITLISPDNSISITDLKNAQNISQRRDLKLVKIQDQDAKTRRPIYKLMTNSEYHEEELKQRKEKQDARLNNKGDKLITFSTRIADHDLMTNIKKMIKLVNKHYEVRVVIQGDTKDDTIKLDDRFALIEQHVKQAARIVQKRIKNNTLKFQLLPNKKLTTSANENSEAEGSNENSNNSGPL